MRYVFDDETKSVGVVLEKSMYRDLKGIATDLQTSVSTVCRIAIKRFLEDKREAKTSKDEG